jgi:hypothetical protein
MGLGVLAAAVLALPSQVGAAKPTATADITPFPAALCGADATYEWSGFPSAWARTAEISIFVEDLRLAHESVVTDANHGTIDTSASFPIGQPFTSRVVGHLLDKKGRVIAQSEATDSVFTPCAA